MTAADEILRRERDAIETEASWGLCSWLAWLCKGPPRFPTYRNVQSPAERGCTPAQPGATISYMPTQPERCR
jgi:hypothetical protein